MNYNVECYIFHNYGYMARDCRSMMNHNFECYKCHNYGHIAHDYRSMMKSCIKDNTDIDIINSRRIIQKERRNTLGLVLYTNDEIKTGNQSNSLI